MAERMSRRLVLLSSAAIGTVYAAGYLGTRAADASLGATAVAGTATSAGEGGAAPTAPASVDTLAAAQPPAVVTTSGGAVTTAPVSAAPGGPATERATTSQHTASSTPTRPAIAKAPPEVTATTVPAPVVTNQHVGQPVALPPTATQVAVPPAPQPAATAAPVRRAVATVPERPTATPTIVRPAAKPTATMIPSGNGYRDGTFTALGTSRRGDIRVALTIKGGRIATVAITDATTQYPVSWISPLRGEVVARQSARVDLVSGATYSSLAFQGAVQRALAQATA